MSMSMSMSRRVGGIPSARTGRWFNWICLILVKLLRKSDKQPIVAPCPGVLVVLKLR